MLWPLDPNGAEKLNQPELEVLWRLASTTNERVRLRFLDEAMRTEGRASQLRHRMAWSIHGAVGLDSQRRVRAEQLLAQGLKDPNKKLRHRIEIAWTALELCERGSPLQRTSAEVISRAWAAEKNSDLRNAWQSLLSARVDRFGPDDAARLLNQLLAQENDSDIRQRLAYDLAVVAERLEPAEAARMCTEAARLLNQDLAKENDGKKRSQLAQGLGAVVKWLEPAEAARISAKAAQLLIQDLAKGKR